MTASLIDGKQIAADLRGELATKVTELGRAHNIQPGLAVVLVGEDPASQVYVKNKGLATTKAGMASFEHRLSADTPMADLLALIARLNNDDSVDGILVQLPLPDHLDEKLVVNAIDPAKDVDGLTEINAGRLLLGATGLVPCTPMGSVILAKTVLPDLSGKHAVVLGRSILVGKPLSLLLQNENCTVTMAHSRTKDLPAVCREADILCVAVGRPEMVQADWIKPGAVVIDIGINRVAGEGRSRLVGDVAFEGARGVAGAITPVPGGVGPMTIACLLKNTLRAAVLRRDLDFNL